MFDQTFMRGVLVVPFALAVVCSATKVDALPAKIFTSKHLEQIQTSLPPGLVMRLPSEVLLSDRLDDKFSKYTIKVSNSTSQSDLTVNIFSCQKQTQSCLVGTFVVAAKASLNARNNFKKYQVSATPVTISNNIQAYFLADLKPKFKSSYSSIMWEQDQQFYQVKLLNKSRQNLINAAYSMTQAVPIKSTSRITEQREPVQVTNTTRKINLERSPLIIAQSNESAPDTSEQKLLLQTHTTVLTTAEQLRRGEILTEFRYRQSFPSGSARDVGLTGQPTLGISWGVTDNLELKLDLQTVDNFGPGEQGDFIVRRVNIDGTGPNFFQEITLQAKQQIWQNEAETLALSGVIAASYGDGGRPYRAIGRGSITSEQNNSIVPSLELPFTINPTENLQLTISPKLAFLPEDNALYFTTLPIDNSGSFGTNFGLAGGISYQLNTRLLLWGDAFVPFTGNNTINRDTGLPAKTVAFNAGLRYLVNPRLATDLFVSNTLGNTGALSIVADKSFTSVGLGVTFIPGVTSANREYPKHFGETQQPSPDTPAGFSFLDGGTIADRQLRLNLQGGSQGILASLRYGLLDDFEIGAFIDYISGTVDESELGLSGRIRFLHQADGDPFTLSGAVTVARSNNVLINLVNDNANEFDEQGFEKRGFALRNEQDGELIIITLSTPIHYQFQGGSAIWLTPILGYVQRNGLEIGGFTLGGSVAVARNLDVIAETGLDLTGKGNGFIGNNRETIIPWTVGLRWEPSDLFGISDTDTAVSPQFELYLTNRVGSSPFHSLRVRDDNDIAVGVGLSLPIQF